MNLTYVLMACIGGITYLAWQKPEWQKRLMLNPYLTIQHKEYWRLLTSGFVHNNGMHLLLNLFTLYFFGRAIEQIFSAYFTEEVLWLYPLFFMTAVIVANLPTVWKYRDNPGYNSLGASGGVSAFVLAFILFDPLRDLCLYGVFCLPGYLLGLLFIIYSIVMSKKGSDNINHDAHLFGALYGLLFVWVLRPDTLQTFLNVFF